MFNIRDSVLFLGFAFLNGFVGIMLAFLGMDDSLAWMAFWGCLVISHTSSRREEYEVYIAEALRVQRYLVNEMLQSSGEEDDE